ncbi:hypothetical protein BGZ73_006970 [Actinomortierella ambigua]|nr:hypothetical protein BGZ73_006970 [Actinomortierella ambigua]
MPAHNSPVAGLTFIMLKSTLIALLAFAATVSAQQMPDHIAFTQPVSDKPLNFPPGTVHYFSWLGACQPPGTLTSPTPTAAKVELIDSTDSNNAVYRKHVTNIDCTQRTGNVNWTVPTDLSADALYSLQIVLSPRNAYSGKFTIKPEGSASNPPPNNNAGGADKPKSAASGLTVTALSAAAAVAGAALLF